MPDAENDVTPWKPEDGDTKCQDCNRPNAPWFAANDLWNAVMTNRVTEWLDGVPMGGDPGGCLCPVCFVRRADAAGIKTVWQLVPQWSGRAEGMRDIPLGSTAPESEETPA